MGFDFNNKKNVSEKENNISYAPAKRHLAKWQWYLLVLIILSPVLYFLAKIVADEFIVVASGYVAYDKISVRAPESGYIDSVSIKEGGHVKSGQLLMHIHSPKVTENVNHLQKELSLLKKLQLNTKNPAIEHFMIMKEKLQKHLRKTIAYVKTMEYLRGKKLSTIVDTQKARIDLKDIELEIADIDRRIAESNINHKFKLENQYGKIISELKREIIGLRISLCLMDIKSSWNGNITKIFTNGDEYVTKGQPLMSIATKDNLRVIAHLNHRFMSGKIYQGKKVTVILPDNLKIKGKISKIPNLAEHQDKSTNIIKQEKNKILLIISLQNKLPQKYQIYGLPVKVVLEGYGFDFLIG